jgi:hypothetical protein
MNVNELKLQILHTEIHYGRWDWREITVGTAEKMYNIKKHNLIFLPMLLLPNDKNVRAT